MLGSKFEPKNQTEFESKSLNANNLGILFTATKNQSTTSDLKLTDDHVLTGGLVRVIDGCLGDKLKFQVVDVDNIMGYGANTVLGQYVTDWFVDPTESLQADMNSPYPAKIFGNLYLRVIYTSDAAATVDAKVIINYRLHKILW